MSIKSRVLKPAAASMLCASALWACTARQEPEASGRSAAADFAEALLRAPWDTVVAGDSLVVSVKDAKIGGGFTALIDGGTHQVFVIPNGENAPQAVGRTGEGAGEYVRPNKLAFAEGQMVVLDERLNRITRFEQDATSGQWRSVASKAHGLSMEDLCIDGTGAPWVFAVDGGDAMHKLSPDLGQVVFSLPGGFDPDDAPAAEMARRGGGILCHAGAVVSGFAADNKIRIYDGESGNLLREWVFPEISPVEIALGTVNGAARITTRYSTGAAYDERGAYSDHLRSLFVLEGSLVAQYVRGFNKSQDTTYVASVIVDMETGSHQVTEKLPLIVDVQDGRFLTLVEKPGLLLRMHTLGTAAK